MSKKYSVRISVIYFMNSYVHMRYWKCDISSFALKREKGVAKNFNVTKNEKGDNLFATTNYWSSAITMALPNAIVWKLYENCSIAIQQNFPVKVIINCSSLQNLFYIVLDKNMMFLSQNDKWRVNHQRPNLKRCSMWSFLWKFWFN